MEYLIKTLGNEVVMPLLRRAGTVVATYLITVGATNDTAETIVVGLFAAASLSYDLTASWLVRRSRKETR